MKTARPFVLSLFFLGVGGAKTAAAAAEDAVAVEGAASAAGVGATRTASTTLPLAATRDDRVADEDREWAERESKLNEASTLTGGVGLLHTQHAQGGAAGQFRVDFTTEYFSAGFLCTQEFPCADPRNPGGMLQSDSADHFGGRLRLSMQVLEWLDTYLATGALANSNPANRPTLLQVLGDSTLGAKAHGALSKVVHVGGALELWLVNGTGAVGLDGAGTSAKFRGLTTVDLRAAEARLPLRFSANLTYVLDNSGQVVESTERARGTPVTRIERYGLNIHRVDHFDAHVGGELFLVEERVRPFVEYALLIPVNRQGYRCSPNNPSSDKCLATDAFAPSSLTVGSRFFPWKKGFNVTAAFDIGVSGVGFFIEEMRPTPPWMLYLGAGWAFDTQEKPPVVRERIVEQERGLGSRIRGFVHEGGRTEGIANAIAFWESHPELTSLATGMDGHFTTHELSPGRYVFAVRADGYEPGRCTATIVETRAPALPAASLPVGDVQLDCALKALPSVGGIVGKVKDLETGLAVGNATIHVVDGRGEETKGASDTHGNFRFGRVTPGEATLVVDAEGYLASTEKLHVKDREESAVVVAVRRSPKNPLVTVQTQEIVIRQQVQFGVNSAEILPASTGLLEEIVDVLLKNPRIRRIEVQGHTDGTGQPAYNLKLSEDRARSVVAWLTAHGVAPSRLVAKGYGDSKPLVPNVTALNKQRNRRVQFIILDQDSPGGLPADIEPTRNGSDPRTSP